MYLSKSSLSNFFAVRNGRLYHGDIDVRRKPESMPAGFEKVPVNDIAWTLIAGESPVGEVHIINDDIVSAFTPSNMIDTGTGKYANGSPVDPDMYEMYGIVDNFDAESNRPKNNPRLPIGVTKLPGGKFRFKRSSNGLKEDVVKESYEDILEVAKEYELRLADVNDRLKESKTLVQSLKSSGIDMKNIYLRGRQYFVEFMINGKRICVMKTYDLHEAVLARDNFVKERRRAAATVAQNERLLMIKAYEEMLVEGLQELDYGKLKTALNFLTEEEFMYVVDSEAM